MIKYIYVSLPPLTLFAHDGDYENYPLDASIDEIVHFLDTFSFESKATHMIDLFYSHCVGITFSSLSWQALQSHLSISRCSPIPSMATWSSNHYANSLFIVTLDCVRL